MADQRRPSRSSGGPNNPRKPSRGKDSGAPKTRPDPRSGNKSSGSERPRGSSSEQTPRGSSSSERPRSSTSSDSNKRPPRTPGDRAYSDRQSGARAGSDRRTGDRPGTDRGGAYRSDRPDRSDRPERLWPDLPDDITGDELDEEVFLGDLRGLSAENARWVARHLVMVARCFDDNPDLAWEHAQAAVRRAGRIAVVRETAGLAAYRAGHFARALTELRAARRMSGSQDQLPIMADCERGLGRPEKALEIAGSKAANSLNQAGRIEMRIVAAGARADLAQLDAALVTLQCPELSQDDQQWGPRLRYAYADTLEALGRPDEAATWFAKASLVDVDGQTDAEERLVLLGVSLDAETISDDEVIFMDLED